MAVSNIHLKKPIAIILSDMYECSLGLYYWFCFGLLNLSDFISEELLNIIKCKYLNCSNENETPIVLNFNCRIALYTDKGCIIFLFFASLIIYVYKKNNEAQTK